VLAAGVESSRLRQVRVRPDEIIIDIAEPDAAASPLSNEWDIVLPAGGAADAE